jgi:hypothetical protein
LFYTTLDLVKEGFQKRFSSLPGMKHIAKKQKVSHQVIKQTRLAKAVRQGADDFFCNDGNVRFLFDVIAQLPYSQRQERIRAALARCQSEVIKSLAWDAPETPRTNADRLFEMREKVGVSAPYNAWYPHNIKSTNMPISHVLHA